MERIGLFGGSFDPIHLGHLLVVQAAREELNLSRIFFVPAAQSPFKPEAKPSPGADRVRLLGLALAGWEFCELDQQELQRGGISYTIDTIEWYGQRYPGSKLFYLIGADHVVQLPKWRDAGKLAELVEFVVISRPGEETFSFPSPFRGLTLKGFPLGLSSSQIRDRIRSGLPIGHLVPPAVEEAILNYRLYL